MRSLELARRLASSKSENASSKRLAESRQLARRLRAVFAEREVERRSLTGLALRPNAPPVPLNDSMHDREAYTSTLEFRFQVHTLENSKQLPGILHVEARTI